MQHLNQSELSIHIRTVPHTPVPKIEIFVKKSMLYKRPEHLQDKSSASAKRNFILILLTFFLVIISYAIYANKSYKTETTVKYRAIKEIVDEPYLNIPAVGGGGGGGDSDVDIVNVESEVKHKEVFVFSERDPIVLMKYDIFMYDSATGEKKQLTRRPSEKEQDESNINKEYNYYINPKFSDDGNTIYFVEARDVTFKICSMDLNGENSKTIVNASKSNFSISGSSIIYFDYFRNVTMYDIKSGATKSLYSHNLQDMFLDSFRSTDHFTIEYDFPVLSKDKKKLYFVLKKQSGKYQIQKNFTSDTGGIPCSTVIHSGYDRIADIKLSPDDNFLLITFGTNVLKIFDIEEAKFIHSFTSDKESRVTSATWSEDGKSVYWVRDDPYNNIIKMSIDKEGQDSEVIVKDFVGYFISLKPEAVTGIGGGGDAPEPETFIYASNTLPGISYNVIYSQNTSSDIKTQLTGTKNDPNFGRMFRDLYPKYSPDGNTIAFCRAYGSLTLHVMNSDGTDIRALVNSKTCKDYCFSNDNKYLFYITTANQLSSINIETGTIDVILAADGSRHFLTYPIYVDESVIGYNYVYYFQYDDNLGFCLKRISSDIRLQTTIETVLDHLNFSLNSVSLSPDSSKLLLNTTNPGETFIFYLKTNELTKNPMTHLDNSPLSFWSNDGKSIYYYMKHPSNTLVKLDTDNNISNIVLDNLPNIHGISLKPSKRNEILIYSENQESNKVIVSHNLRTGIKINLTQNCQDSSPKLTPDGKTIVFCRQMDHKKYSFYQMDIDGKNLKLIENIFLSYCDFNLSSDGKKIIFKTKINEILSIGFENSLIEPFNVKGNLPTMSFDGNFLYYVNGTKLFRKDIVVDSGLAELVNEFEMEIRDFRLSRDGIYAAIIYGKIVTIISLKNENIFIPLMDGECPIEDVIWSNDSKWLYLRRGAPKKDLIRIKTSHFDITKSEIVLDKLETDSFTQIIPIK